jgi:succinate dehydrogenase / fumarate reductase, membrane anchor subunit
MSDKPIPGFRSELSRVRGLGSAKSGTAHWWAMRLSSLALIPLCLYIIATFFCEAAKGGFPGALAWVQSPLTAVFLILFLIVAFQHAVSGVQEVVEDYVHNEYTKIATMLTVRLLAAIFALVGIFAVIAIKFQVPLPHA